MLEHITFTGADDATPIDALQSISDRFGARVEWGVLLSESRAGSSRYPSVDWRRALIERTDASLCKAAHLCGDSMLNRLASADPNLLDELRAYQRVQINIDAFAATEALLDGILRTLCAHTALSTSDNPGAWIVQYNTSNADWVHEIMRHVSDGATPPIHVLVDASGGEGRAPTQWQAPAIDTPIGFAGGLSPSNLGAHLPVFRSLMGAHDFWVDMETGIRDQDDQFDAHAAEMLLAEHFPAHDERGWQKRMSY